MLAQQLPFNYVFLAFCLLKIDKTVQSLFPEQKQQHHVTSQKANLQSRSNRPHRPATNSLDVHLPCLLKWQCFQDAHYFALAGGAQWIEH